MGIDAKSFSAVLPRGTFFRLTGEKALSRIETLCAEWALSNELGPYFNKHRTNESSTVIQIIPVADPLVFTLVGRGISVEFRSSNTGPGYHAACIDLIDFLGKNLSLSWEWSQNESGYFDETDYAVHRDFQSLRKSMIHFLTALVSLEDKSFKHEGAMLPVYCLPLGVGSIEGSICTPLGTLPSSWQKTYSESGEDSRESMAGDFFIWWEKGLSNTTWINLLRAQLWQNAEWHNIKSESALTSQKQIDHTLHILQSRKIPIPPDLAEAYSEYQFFRSSATRPDAKGIGYRKRAIFKKIFPSWSIKLPGYLSEIVGSDDAQWEHTDMSLIASSFSIRNSGTKHTFPSDFSGDEVLIKAGLSYRKTAIKLDDDGFYHQGAMCIGDSNEAHRVLLLTLSSKLDWPFKEFDSWLKTVV